MGTVLGALYKPVDEIVPQDEPTHPDPLTFQVTAVLALPVTVAVNCCCAFTATCAVFGERLIATLGADSIVTIALPASATVNTGVAVTVTVLGLGTAAGAVYKPEELIVPQLIPTHPAPVRFQITRVGVPAIAAENCTCEPGLTCERFGETATATAALD